MKLISSFGFSVPAIEVGPQLLLSLLVLLMLSACQPSANSDLDTENPDTPWDWSEDYVHREVNHVRAGRDLNPETWPGGAKVAVLLSYDVDNETVMGLRNGEISVGPLSQG